ncbi:tRNA (adenosine(37)-N6)-threonylcarbamoyltransferase complex dimerization subunit type 1 TsaB [Propionibacterium freudenreichii]|uniref:tRNA (adenosine(37)-N6)-threonylcarbamoyltransferase complex dimerization subunit type 1 TsaB n=1 Tax=Propionibacterium freudenreichii TaxID=1744 RepID=UPI0005CC2B4D|nr:tRNA (adenosine(37)-N6)-threonylcarbamoyltransferase complex dimerization subunit type 1 TsaB [Propionibacterium freudenreichii]AJQ90321.1 Universal bacterial protein YeaZ [Propionibacterium freudenreichii subsp. freudenreichii]
MTTWTLCIDTSTDVCAGLARDSEVVASAHVGDNHSHVELLMPTIMGLLADAGIGLSRVDRVGVGSGPGPFTGLRVGMATAFTLEVAGNKPVKGVCSLDVMAAQWRATAPAPDEFVIASDARRKELYWARYDQTGRRGEPQVTLPTALPDLPIAGPGVAVFAELLTSRMPAGAPTSIDAGFMAAHLSQLPDAGREPMYLREPDAKPPSARKSALAGSHRRLGPAVRRTP